MRFDKISVDSWHTLTFTLISPSCSATPQLRWYDSSLTITIGLSYLISYPLLLYWSSLLLVCWHVIIMACHHQVCNYLFFLFIICCVRCYKENVRVVSPHCTNSRWSNNICVYLTILWFSVGFLLCTCTSCADTHVVSQECSIIAKKGDIISPHITLYEASEIYRFSYSYLQFL